MNDDWKKHEETIAAAAKKMGLMVASAVDGELDVGKDGRPIGTIRWIPKQRAIGGWHSYSPVGVEGMHDTPRAALKALVENAKKDFFVVELTFAKELGPVTDEQRELYREACEFLAEVLYAYRHRLAQKRTKLKKVLVGAVVRNV